MARKKKLDKAELLKDVCLHCGFMTMHHDKWPNWKPEIEYDETNVEHNNAFNDLVRSAAKIVAEVFMMLSPLDQMKFMSNVMSDVQRAEERWRN